MRKRPLGELELEVLRFVADHAPCTVREVSEGFAEPRGLARTTVLTVMERLRRKGYLARRKGASAFSYSPASGKGDVMHDVVKDFVEKTLGGSLTPFVAYLAKTRGLSEVEVDQLNELVRSMDEEKVDE